MTYRESVLHEEFGLHLFGKKDFKYISNQEMMLMEEEKLTPVECEGINPYKVYELFKNFQAVSSSQRSVRSDYAEPSPGGVSKGSGQKGG